MITASDRAHARVHRLLTRELGAAVSRTVWGTWVTTSSLPHEIRIDSVVGVALLRISAGAVIGVRQTRALLETINARNVDRALTKRMWVDGKVLVVAEQPLASLRPGDVELLVSAVLCCARLDAAMLARHGGTDTTGKVRDPVRDINSWPELLEVTGTATARELAVWIGAMTGADCWIENSSDLESGTVVGIGGRGTGLTWPCTLRTVLRDVEDLRDELEAERDVEDEADTDLLEAGNAEPAADHDLS